MLVPQTLAEETEKVTYRDITVDKNTEYVDLGDRKVLQWDKLYDFLLQLSMDFHMKMREVKVHNELRVRNGVHNWEYWHLALRMSLPFASRNFGEN